MYWAPKSYSDGKPVWTFNYTSAESLIDLAFKTKVVVDAIRDEIRSISPGFMLGEAAGTYEMLLSTTCTC